MKMRIVYHFTNPWVAQMSRSGEGLLSHPAWVGAASSNNRPAEGELHKRGGGGGEMYADCFQTQSRVVAVCKPGSSFFFFYLPALFFLQAFEALWRHRPIVPHPSSPSSFLFSPCEIISSRPVQAGGCAHLCVIEVEVRAEF